MDFEIRRGSVGLDKSLPRDLQTKCYKIQIPGEIPIQGDSIPEPNATLEATTNNNQSYLEYSNNQ